MKILMVHRPSSPGKGNPYVASLAGELARRGHAVDMSVDRFWGDEGTYDVVHFHWPKVLFGERWCEVSDADVDLFRARLASFRARGAKIFYTRHNAVQHYGDAAQGLNRVYGLLEEEADGVFHMGEFSRRELLSRFGAGDAPRQFVVPHQVYHDMPRDIPKAEACRRLGLDPSRRIVLSFGAFRAHEEREMVFAACRDAGVPGLTLLAPRFFKGPVWRGGIRSTLREWRYRRSFAAPWTAFGAAHVPETDIPLYFSAADVVFIQRKRILNSGNLPMAFYYGKPVLGPDVGDVGELLRATGNPAFDPESPSSVVAALCEALDTRDLGVRNRAKADADWRLTRIADQVESAYIAEENRFSKQGEE